MTILKIKRTAKPNSPPTDLQVGELSVEMAEPTRLWVGVPPEIEPTGKKLLVDLQAEPASKAYVDAAVANSAALMHTVLNVVKELTARVAALEARRR